MHVLLLDIVADEAHPAEIETQLRENETANGSICVWSFILGHSDSVIGVIMLGYAGHCVWPSLS